LLDVLVALEVHRPALVVVGAQAVYERTKDVSLIEPTSTRDSDIVIDPALVASEPLIAEVMEAAGFVQDRPERPGIYVRKTTGFPPSVDLITPEAVAGPGRRAARIQGQDKHAVGRAPGLEMVLLDRDEMGLGPIGSSSRPALRVHVAGPAALLCAKAWKLSERIADAEAGKTWRVRPKDAVDMARLMLASDPIVVNGKFRDCSAHPVLGEAVKTGQQRLLELFGPQGRALDIITITMGANANVIREAITDWIDRFSRANI